MCAGTLRLRILRGACYIVLLGTMSSSDSEDFDFWAWVKLVGLSEANVKKLEHNLVTDF